jgi:hypothetical protein
MCGILKAWKHEGASLAGNESWEASSTTWVAISVVDAGSSGFALEFGVIGSASCYLVGKIN